MKAFHRAFNRPQFRLRDCTLDEAMPKIDLLRKRISEMAQRYATIHAMQLTFEHIDSAILAAHDGEPHVGGQPFTRAMTQCRGEHRDIAEIPIGGAWDDLRARLLLFPFEGDVIGIMEGGQMAYTHAWIRPQYKVDRRIDSAVAEVWDFDLTMDPTGNVYPDEWEKRRRGWTAFLGAKLDCDPEDVGLEAILHTGRFPQVTIEDVISEGYSHECRVQALTQKRMTARSNAGGKKEFPDTPSYWKAFYEEAARISPILPEDITAEMIRAYEDARDQDTPEEAAQ